MVNEFYDPYFRYDPAKDIQADNLEKKYITEDAGTKKISIDNFQDFNMVDKNSISTQIHEYPRIQKILIPFLFEMFLK